MPYGRPDIVTRQRPGSEKRRNRLACDEIHGHDYALTPGRYVGAADGDEDDEPLEEKFPPLLQQLEEQFGRSAELEKEIRRNLAGLGPKKDLP